MLPSVGRQETWGLAVNEAMNCRCAVIVSDHVGCAQDLVIDGDNGRVIQAGSESDLESAIRELLNDPTRLTRRQERSAEIVEHTATAAAQVCSKPSQPHSAKGTSMRVLLVGPGFHSSWRNSVRRALDGRGDPPRRSGEPSARRGQPCGCQPLSLRIPVAEDWAAFTASTAASSDRAWPGPSVENPILLFPSTTSTCCHIWPSRRPV